MYYKEQDFCSVSGGTFWANRSKSASELFCQETVKMFKTFPFHEKTPEIAENKIGPNLIGLCCIGCRKNAWCVYILWITNQ